MIILFNIFILSWLLTQFSPIKMITDTIPTQKLNPFISLLMSVIILPFYCLMCMSFWVGLIYTHNIIIAATASFIGYIWNVIQKKLDYEKFM